MPTAPETFQLHFYGAWAAHAVWDVEGRRLVWGAGYDPAFGSPDGGPAAGLGARGEARPAPGDWGTFWTILDGIDVWSWEARYVFRGTTIEPAGWRVAIRHGPRHVQSGGCRLAEPPGWDLFTRS